MESEIQYPSVNSMQIQRPKKNGGNSFLCSISKDKKKKPYTISIKNAKIMKFSELSTPGESYLYLIPKSRADFNSIYDINQRILEIVKENEDSWFNNNMNIELIDDYYTTTLIYDKLYGDIIKLKVISSLYPEIKELDKNKFYDLKITLLQLRFFKQKFVLETCIEAYEESEAICFIDDSEEEIREELVEDDISPSYEEIEMMRQEVIDKYGKKINIINEKLSEKQNLELERDVCREKLKIFENLTDTKEIIELCGKE